MTSYFLNVVYLFLSIKGCKESGCFLTNVLPVQNLWLKPAPQVDSKDMERSCWLPRVNECITAAPGKI